MDAVIFCGYLEKCQRSVGKWGGGRVKGHFRCPGGQRVNHTYVLRKFETMTIINKLYISSNNNKHEIYQQWML